MKEAAGPATGGLGFYCQSSAAQETLAREVISFSEKTCYTLSLFFECLFSFYQNHRLLPSFNTLRSILLELFFEIPMHRTESIMTDEA